MPYEALILDKKPIATMTLNRPERRNAMNRQLMQEIYLGFQEVAEDDSIRVLIVRGAGGNFCAGADLNEVLNKTIMEYRRHFSLLPEIFRTIARMGKPVIAAVEGYALAGGLGLAVTCDLTIASEDATFGATEVKIGLFPMIISAPIFRLVGRKRGMELFFVGEMFSSQEAERIGLINHAVPKERFEDEVMGLAEKLASLSPAVLRLGKDALYTQSDMEYFKAMDYLKDMVAIISTTEDSKEGIDA
ncbi:MAG: enoyl-CoA hydratase/isomerase family protein, partial [Dehalococcoidia bacterium]|nr:enoyl-CoA hydratase/isomerase family protein [Dehalococcoidia bacterium]